MFDSAKVGQKRKSINFVQNKLEEGILSKGDWKQIEEILMKRKIRDGSQKNKQIAKLIEDISIEEYEKPDPSNVFTKINHNNIKRAKRVVYIRKNKADKEVDFLEENNREKYKNFGASLSEKEMVIMKRAGYPSFLTKRVKKTTQERYKSLKGLTGS